MMTEIRLGFSTGVFYGREEISLENAIMELNRVAPEVIELNIASPTELAELSEAAIELCRRFKVRTIHAPFKDVRYDAHSKELLLKLKELAERLTAHYLVFHPDTIDDFELVEEVLGSLVAIENMDWRKSVGKTVAELQAIFAQMPSAGWLCDLNHVFTLDPSMQLAQALYDVLGDRLVGYHVSDFGGDEEPHTNFFVKANEDGTSQVAQTILGAIQKIDVPIIDEGASADQENFLELERNLLNRIFTK